MAEEILIADSDKSDQDEFERIFEATSYRLLFAENGEDALQQIRFFKPKLIIAGTDLREKDGFQLCSAVKTDREFKQIPVILLAGLFEDVSAGDVERVRADGVIAKPLHEGEILNLVDRLMERGAKKEGESVLGGVAKTDGGEDVIELLDVVEEPESHVSIQDFIAEEKEGHPAELPSLEAWQKKADRAGVAEGAVAAPESGRTKEEEVFKLAQEVIGRGKKEPGEKDLFEKVPLEDILQKMETIQPTIDKEPPGRGEARTPEETLTLTEEGAEKPFSLEGFEEALQREVKEPAPQEVGQIPPLLKEPPEELPFVETPSPQAKVPRKSPVEELEALLAEPGAETPAGEPDLEEEDLSMAGLREALGDMFSEERPEEKAEQPRPPDEGPIEEELPPLATEPKLFEEEPFVEEALPVERAAAEVLEEEAWSPGEKAEEEFPRELLEEETLEEEVPLAQAEKEEAALLEEMEALRASAEPAPSLVDIFEEGAAAEILEVSKPAEEPGLMEEAASPSDRAAAARLPEAKMEEVIAKGVEKMMQDLVTKVVPEMTQHILGLTVERIESMVKEIVPEIAEKAIQEEIRKLEEGEKE